MKQYRSIIDPFIASALEHGFKVKSRKWDIFTHNYFEDVEISTIDAWLQECRDIELLSGCITNIEFHSPQITKGPGRILVLSSVIS